MNSKTSLSIVALIALLAVGVWSLLGGGDGGAPTDLPQGDAAVAQGFGDARQGQVADAAEGAMPGDPSARVSLDPRELEQGGAAGPAVIGRVVDKSGAPLEGVEIIAVASFDPDWSDPDSIEAYADGWWVQWGRMLKDRVTARTAADGSFRVRARGTSKRVQLLAQLMGYQRTFKDAKRPADADVDAGSITLNPGGTVSGKVVDRAGRPVEGAMVSVTMRNWIGGDDDYDQRQQDQDEINELWNGQKRTDAEGRFELDGTNVGDIIVLARHPDHPLARLEGLHVEAGGRLGELVVVLDPGASISGRVTEIPAGTKGIRIVASSKLAEGSKQSEISIVDGEIVRRGGAATLNRTARIESDGSFLVRGLQPSMIYQLVAMQQVRGYGRDSACSMKSDVPAGATGVTVRFEAGASVTLQIVDDATGAPIEELWVVDSLRGGEGGYGGWDWMSNQLRPRRYPEGRIVVANLRPGDKQKLSLDVEALGHDKWSKRDIDVPKLGTLDLGVVRLGARPVVRVHVQEKDSAAPIVGAMVSVRPIEDQAKRAGMEVEETSRGWFGQPQPPRQLKTDDDGNVVLNSFPGARCKVTVNEGEHARYESEPIEMPAKGDFQHLVSMLHGGTVEARALDSEGKPLTRAQVQRRGPDGSNDTNGTDQDGIAKFEHLSPGTYSFRIRRGNADDTFGMIVDAQASKGDALPGWVQVEVAEGAKVALDLRKEPVGKLVGTISENDKPLDRASVAVSIERPGDGNDHNGKPRMDRREIGRARTKADGSYAIDDLPAGDVIVRVTHNSRSMSSDMTSNVHLGDNQLDIDLDTTVIRGVVRDGTGKPLAKASVSISRESGAGDDQVGQNIVFGDYGNVMYQGSARGSRTRTADDGSYELRGVTPDTNLIVNIDADSFMPARSAPVSVPRGQTREGIDFALSPAGIIVIRTSAERGNARISATSVGTDPKDVAKASGMVRDGNARLDHLRSGTWTVTLTPRGESPITRQVEVIAGQTVTVDF